MPRMNHGHWRPLSIHADTLAVTTLSTADLPTWLIALSWTMITLGILCAIVVLIDIIRHPQPMGVMNVVWPICALFGSLIWLGAYFWWGRASAPATPVAGSTDKPAMAMSGMKMPGMKMPGVDTSDPHHSGTQMSGMHMSMKRSALGLSAKPHTMPVSVFIGTSHCGAGCSLADLIVEWTAFLVPSILIIGGATWLFTDPIFAVWVIAYVAALAIGITFQYFAIAPMNPGRSAWKNLAAAAKADVLSLTAWQVGMYGTIAIMQLAVFPAWLDGRLAVNTPVFWAVMQLAMLAGFCTAYPVNWWLISSGIKERM